MLLHKTSMLMRLLFVIFAISLLSFSFEFNLFAEEQSDYKVAGYYTSWNPPEQLAADHLTHVNFAFADVCWDGEHGNPEVWVPEGEDNVFPCTDLDGHEQDLPNGTVVLASPEEDLPALAELNQLKKSTPQLKTLVSIGGWSLSNNISLAARTEEARETFAASAVDYMRHFNMDGIDLDWEFPVVGGMSNNHRDPSDKENHTLLLQAIRDQLDKAEVEDDKDYLLTIASSVTYSYPENNELDKISTIVDFINIMTYDFNGTWMNRTAHNAPLYRDDEALEYDVNPYHIDEAVDLHLTSGVPKNKLVLGLPFYGKSWGQCNEVEGGNFVENGGYQLCDGPGDGDIEPGSYSYGYLKEELINKNGYTSYWNEAAQVPFLYNDELGEFVSYDDVQSIRAKVDYVKEKGLAGAMIWEINQDDAAGSLLQTISTSLEIKAGGLSESDEQHNGVDEPEGFENEGMLEEPKDETAVDESQQPDSDISTDKSSSGLQNKGAIFTLLGIASLIILYGLITYIYQQRKNK